MRHKLSTTASPCVLLMFSQTFEIKLSYKFYYSSVKCNFHFYDVKLRIVDLMISKAFLKSGSVMVKGGAKRIISPWVGLANTPFSASLTQTSQASYFSAMTIRTRNGSLV